MRATKNRAKKIAGKMFFYHLKKERNRKQYNARAGQKQKTSFFLLILVMRCLNLMRGLKFSRDPVDLFYKQNCIF